MRRAQRLLLSAALATAGAVGFGSPAGGRDWEIRIPDHRHAALASSRYRLTLSDDRAELAGDGIQARSESLDGIGRITILGSAGADTLTVDLRGALRDVEVDFDGGPGFDALAIQGTVALDSVTYAPGPGNDEGVLTYRLGDRALILRFRGLEPVLDATTVTTFILDSFPGVGAPNTITYSAGGSCNPGTDNTWGKLEIDTFECVEFKNKGTVDIRAGDGADVFNLFNGSRPTGLVQLIARGGNGADKFNLRAAASGVTTTLHGDSDSDSFHISSSAPMIGGSLDGIAGNVSLHGDGHGSGGIGFEIKGILYTVDSGDFLLVDDLGDPDAATYSLADTALSRTGTGTMSYATIESLQLFTGAGPALVNAASTPSSSYTFVGTQDGPDTLAITNTGADSILDVDTAGGADTVTVLSTGPDGTNTDGLGAFLRVSGGDGSDLLVLTGSGTSSRTQLSGENGADSIQVQSTAASSVAVAEGGPNNDSVTLGSSDSLDGIQGDVSVDGGGHDATPTRALEINGDTSTLPTGDWLELRDLADLDANIYEIDPATVARTGAASVEHLAIETLNVLAGSAAPSAIVIHGTPPATSTLVQGTSQPETLSIIDTGADSVVIADLSGGADSFTLGDAGADGADTDAFGAFIQVNGGSGSDAFDYYGAPALVIGGGDTGVLLPPAGQHIAYMSFEDAAYNPDFGDAPDSYGTLQASDGARHGGGGLLRLGASWDAEADGAPSADASGDGGDEDGVAFTTPIELGADSVGASFTVSSSGVGRVDAWIDFNQDGDFDDADEQILANSIVSAGANPRTFTSFAVTTPGSTYARFRLSTAGGLSPTGPADDGEVEDYRVVVKPIDDLDLTNRVESSTRTFWACISISAGEPFRVLGGADITLHSGSFAAVRKESLVEAGSSLSVLIGAVPGCP